MALTVNTNLASLTVQRNLTNATNGLNTAMERMSTGYKINSASDDAAGYAVASKMKSKLNGYEVAESNGQMATSLLTTEEGVLKIINDYLSRIRDLTEQAANGTYATDSLFAIQTEVVQRMNEINRLIEVTDFNGLNLLNGTGSAADHGINIQIGLNSDTNNVISLDKELFENAGCTSIMGFSAAGTGLTGNVNLDSSATQTTDYQYEATVDGSVVYFKSALTAAIAKQGVLTGSAGAITIADSSGTISIEDMCKSVYSNDNAAREFLNYVDAGVENITGRITRIGAYQNRVNSAIEALSVQGENLIEAHSSIVDADIATESSNYMKYQILQQSAATLLTTANQSPSIALNLI